MTQAVHAVLLADMQPQPWRNGGGATRELLTWRDAADAADAASAASAANAADGPDWQVRISVADIAHDGPFSAFDGIERWFAVLHGNGVQLQLDGHAHALRVGSAPLRFDGAAAPGCTLIDGPTQDLNLMLRRQAGDGRMLAARANEDWTAASTLRALFCTGAAQLGVDGQAAAALPQAGLLWCAQAAGQTWRIDSLAASALAWWLCFQPQR